MAMRMAMQWASAVHGLALALQRARGRSSAGVVPVLVRWAGMQVQWPMRLGAAWWWAVECLLAFGEGLPGPHITVC